MRRLSRGLAGGFVAALAVSALALIGAGPSGAHAAAATTAPTTVAAFIGNDQTLYTYGPSTAAAPVGGPIAPAGAPVAMTRTTDGPAVFFIGQDLWLYVHCPGLAKPARISSVTASPGTPLAAAVAGGSPLAVFFAGHEMRVFSEIPHPCTPITATLVPGFTPPSPLMVSWQPAGGIAATGFADGAFAVLATAADGSVHELSWLPNGGWTDTVAVPAGGATARGLAVAPVPGAAAGADVFELFYASATGQVWKNRLMLGAAPSAPHAWISASAVPVGAPLAAAAGPLGIYLSYVDNAGQVHVLGVDPATDSWQKAEMVSAPNAAPAGSSTALGATADEIDVYCGNNLHLPGRIRFGIGTAGPGTWSPASTKGLLGPGSVIAAG